MGDSMGESVTGSPASRADRRRATEARVLDSARRLFAENGFERTTIRAVAAAARVDPALVMQYFGSKRELFTRAVQMPVALPGATDGGTGTDGADDTDAESPVDALLTALGLKLGGLPDTTLATLRSMLTDPEAAEHAREVLGRQITSIRATLAGDENAELRAALATTVMVGVTIGHQLLGLPALRDAPPDRVAALLRPALRELLATGTETG